jgi:molybdopterin-guanine dinucleotide biosynthesis protein A
MGYHKFQLPFGDKTILECVVKNLQSATSRPVIAVASQDTVDDVRKIAEQLDVQVAVDQRTNSGPLEGMRVGLKTAACDSEWAFVTSCDVPLIRNEVIQLLCRQISLADPSLEAVIPVSESRVYGMTAVYQCKVHSKIDSMIEARQLRVSDLATKLVTKKIGIEDVRRVDPNLESMKNLNTKSQYLEFLREHCIECKPEIEEQLN